MNNNRFLIDMGNRIAGRRKALGMTQEQVAEAMNISIQSLSCIELGKKAIRPENLYNLCIALDVSADYILMGKKSVKQLDGISKKLSALKEDDYQIVEGLIDHLLKE
ncbi:MAG: helix-turn-helix transcriptional regulator [Clostridia bacterium]|nr:helix-turn-helix transcriptional regulator [Clostridia bacterium]MBQ7047438.1 helix-turn-helix transcriptional regulator [Clostridia bacterium]